MTFTTSSGCGCENHLLSSLPPAESSRLAPMLQTVRTEFRQVLVERNAEIEYVYFPCGSVFSNLAIMRNGAAVEVGTIGNEGFVGSELLIGAATAVDTCVCQVGGESLRMRAADFREAVSSLPILRQMTQKFQHAYLSQISQSVACNRLHTIEERFARWILMTHDRVKQDRFHLTQEFLSDMLGVHRPSVSLVAATFQESRLIHYTRGSLTVLDRSGLEQVCCECYRAIKAEFRDVLGIG